MKRKYDNHVAYNTKDCFHGDKAELYADLMWDAICDLVKIDPDMCLVNMNKIGDAVGLKRGQRNIGITILLRRGVIKHFGGIRHRYYEVLTPATKPFFSTGAIKLRESE